MKKSGVEKIRLALVNWKVDILTELEEEKDFEIADRLNAAYDALTDACDKMWDLYLAIEGKE